MCPLIYIFLQYVDATYFAPVVLVFLTAFLPQIPVIHTPTLRFEIKPQVFIRAMQACGAIFVKTPVAQAFVEKTLGTCRDLIRDFVRVYLQLIGVIVQLTLVAGQTITRSQVQVLYQCNLTFATNDRLIPPRPKAESAFKHNPWNRRSGLIYEFYGSLQKAHVSQMVRRTRLIEQSTAWEHHVLPIGDPDALDAVWHEWAIHESIKRYLLVFFLKARTSVLTHTGSTAWFAWRIATIKRILSTLRYRRCFHRTSLLRAYRATTNYGQRRIRLSGHNYSFAPPLMVALKNGYMGRRCSARSPQLDSRDRI